MSGAVVEFATAENRPDCPLAIIFSCNGKDYEQLEEYLGQKRKVECLTRVMFFHLHLDSVTVSNIQRMHCIFSVKEAPNCFQHIPALKL